MSECSTYACLLTKVFGSRAVVLNKHIELGVFDVTDTYW